MVLNRAEIRHLYERTASFYDVALCLARPLGAARWRRATIRSLDLRPGDTVVDLCCGTGANFRGLREAVGPTGRVVGVDLTEAMLRGARTRIERAGWANVATVQADALDYRFPQPIDAVISTYGLEMVPEYDAVLERAAVALPPAGSAGSPGVEASGVLARVARRTRHRPESTVRR